MTPEELSALNREISELREEWIVPPHAFVPAANGSFCHESEECLLFEHEHPHEGIPRNWTSDENASAVLRSNLISNCASWKQVAVLFDEVTALLKQGLDWCESIGIIWARERRKPKRKESS